MYFYSMYFCTISVRIDLPVVSSDCAVISGDSSRFLLMPVREFTINNFLNDKLHRELINIYNNEIAYHD